MDETPARRRLDARVARRKERVRESTRSRSRESRRESRSPRLDVPADTRRQLIRRPNVDSDTFGRFAETFARFMGTARFLMYMTLFVLLWVLFNAVAPGKIPFDEYPFIFLTLMLSLQASYAAPLILLAQNRQEDRDRVIGEQDRQANARAHADMEFLAREMASLRMALGEVATRDYVRSELRSLLQELEERREQEQRDHRDPREPRDPRERAEHRDGGEG